MKIAIISDTHTLHEYLNIPPVDILFHTGDFTSSHGLEKNKIQTERFLEWFSDQKANHKVFIAGNHDMFLESLKSKVFTYMKDNFPELIYLENSSVKIDDFLIYGTPYVPHFYDWAFMRSEEELSRIYKGIPKSTNILLTHGPAYGILDRVPRGRAGSKSLFDEIAKCERLQYHFCGHIHEDRGLIEQNGVTHINATSVGPYYQVLDPVMIEI